MDKETDCDACTSSICSSMAPDLQDCDSFGSRQCQIAHSYQHSLEYVYNNPTSFVSFWRKWIYTFVTFFLSTFWHVVLVHWLIYVFLQIISYKQLRRWIGHFTCMKVHCTNASTNLVRMDRLATRPTRRTCKWNPSMPTWSCSNHYKLYKIPWQVDIIQIFPSCLANKPQ